MRTLIPAFASTALLAACAGAADDTPETTSDLNIDLVKVVDNTEFPWGMVFLPNGDLLFTEQENGLKISRDLTGEASPVSGMPEAYTERQAGYLGLTLDPDFESNRRIYVAYSKGDDDANSTAVIRATLSADSTALTDVEEIFLADTRDTSLHYGARLQFLADGTLAVSLGEGFKFMDDAQSPKNTHGTIVRINTDGSIPEDNPFADGQDGHPAVWSYGHRNVQGLYYDASTQTLYATEHGPKGGDELNIVEKGANYGWPEITYGVNYDGTVITTKTKAEGMLQPETYWVPSIAPSGLTMLTSDVYPGWQGDLFAGGMNGPAGLKLVRLDMENGKVAGRENLLDGEYAIRDVVQGPDGHLYIATKNMDGIFRLNPGP